MELPGALRGVGVGRSDDGAIGLRNPLRRRLHPGSNGLDDFSRHGTGIFLGLQFDERALRLWKPETEVAVRSGHFISYATPLYTLFMQPCGIVVKRLFGHACGMAREDPHFRLRFPNDLREKVEAAARTNKRSMTAEIIARLEASFDLEAGGQSQQMGGDLAAFVEVVDQLRRDLKDAGVLPRKSDSTSG